MADKITYGIKNGHYAPVTHDSEGAPAFGAVSRWEGWSAMSLPPVGDPLEVYADDVVYFKAHINQGYSGTLSAYRIPENFKIDHLGEFKDANGVLIERSTAQPKDFALLGEFQAADETNTDPKRFVLYNCSAGRADLTGSTKTQSIEPVSFSIPITVAPTIKDEFVKATVTKSANESLFNDWFSSVYYNPALVATQRVTITVDDGDVPISGAMVVLGDKAARTNASGVAAFAVPSGTYSVVVTASGFTAQTDELSVTTAPVSRTFTLS